MNTETVWWYFFGIIFYKFNYLNLVYFLDYQKIKLKTSKIFHYS